MPNLTELIARETAKRNFEARGRVRISAPQSDKVHIVRRHKILQNLAGKHVGKLDDVVVAIHVEQAINETLGFSTAQLLKPAGVRLSRGVVHFLLAKYYPDNFDLTKVSTETLISSYCGLAENRLPDGRRFAKFLGQRDLSDSYIQELISKIRVNRNIEFEISVRYKDIMRMADSQHFESCFANWRGGQKLRFLADNCIGLALIRDSKGDFQSRSIIRLLNNHAGDIVLACNRVYGNGLTIPLIADGLRSKIRVYELVDQFAEHVSLTTIGKDFTGVGRTYIWEDSSHSKNRRTGEVTFYGKEVK